MILLLMFLFATLYHVIFRFFFIIVFSVEIVNLKKLQKSINENEVIQGILLLFMVY